MLAADFSPKHLWCSMYLGETSYSDMHWHTAHTAMHCTSTQYVQCTHIYLYSAVCMLSAVHATSVWYSKYIHKAENSPLSIRNCQKEVNTKSKGQLILKGNFGVCLQIYQKTNKIFVRISSLESEMGQIKKIKALYYIKWYIITNLHDNVPLSFLFDPF